MTDYYVVVIVEIEGKEDSRPTSQNPQGVYPILISYYSY